MAKFKDVCHLYLGCKMMEQNGKHSILDARFIGWIKAGVVPAEMAFDKPILRPLSSMTEQENKDLFDGNFVDDGLFTPHEFIKLLSARFDLFGLIESNEAIDATTV